MVKKIDKINEIKELIYKLSKKLKIKPVGKSLNWVILILIMPITIELLVNFNNGGLNGLECSNLTLFSFCIGLLFFIQSNIIDMLLKSDNIRQFINFELINNLDNLDSLTENELYNLKLFLLKIEFNLKLNEAYSFYKREGLSGKLKSKIGNEFEDNIKSLLTDDELASFKYDDFDGMLALDSMDLIIMKHYKYIKQHVNINNSISSRIIKNEKTIDKYKNNDLITEDVNKLVEVNIELKKYLDNKKINEKNN